MSTDDQHAPQPVNVAQGSSDPSPAKGSGPAPEALQQIARDMSKAYEVALEVDPRLYFSGRTPTLANQPR
ncbi:hypothetical protein [Micromonospora sp. KC723]|uniref:hypothetical protein n=1 Tax=Micromonospora sp. KC723 TaxID=2530381 RepID=UPI0010510646|nr:hypothetical protein [Micromonospora sp. KC723]TDB71870.1 hypothetical protein E1165_21860 [Micromonospora sp. KC723]